MARTRFKKAQENWPDFALNIKRAKTTTANTPTNAANTDLGPNGASLSFTVETTCNAFVTVHVAVGSTTDYEMKPQIFLDGVLHTNSDVPASINGGTSPRAFQRSVSNVVQLTAGSHTISAGITVSSATGQSVVIGAGEIIAMVLGNVTA